MARSRDRPDSGSGAQQDTSTTSLHVPAARLHFGMGCEANMRRPQTLGPMVLFGIVIIKFRLFSFQNALEKSNHFANQNKHFQLIL